MLTTDRNDPNLKEINPDGQQKAYLILSEEECAKGFVRPYRNRYIHLKCKSLTIMGQALSETYARNPKFYSGTFCCGCGKHFSLRDSSGWAFEWLDGEPVGSTEEEAKEYIVNKHLGEGI